MDQGIKHEKRHCETGLIISDKSPKIFKKLKQLALAGVNLLIIIHNRINGGLCRILRRKCAGYKYACLRADSKRRMILCDELLCTLEAVTFKCWLPVTSPFIPLDRLLVRLITLFNPASISRNARHAHGSCCEGAEPRIMKTLEQRPRIAKII